MQPYFLASSLFKNKLCRNEEDSSTKFSPPKIAQRSQVRFSILWRSPGRFTAACTGEPARETERSVGSLYCMHGPSALRMPTYSVAVSKFQLPWNLSGFQEPSTTCSPMCAKKKPFCGDTKTWSPSMLYMLDELTASFPIYNFKHSAHMGRLVDN
ncbi:hypothetical protein PMIN05_005149 [Paraphaeosphaeria minitans]